MSRKIKFMGGGIAMVLMLSLLAGVAFAEAGDNESTSTGDVKSSTASKQLKYYANMSGDSDMGVDTSVGYVGMSAGANLSFEMGVPINITATYPSDIQPGQEFSVNVNYSGGVGYIKLHANFMGSISFPSHEYDLSCSFDKTIATYNVQMGNNKTGEIDSVEIPIDSYNLVVTTATLSVKFIFNYVSTTYLTGNLSLTGNAITTPVYEPINGTSSTLNTRAIDNPWGFETANLAVNDLKYHIQHFEVYLSAIEFIVSLSHLDKSYTLNFDVDDLNVYGRAIQTRAGDEPVVGGESYTIKSLGTLSVATLRFPLSILLLKVVLPIVIATVIILAVVSVRRKKKAAIARQEMLNEVSRSASVHSSDETSGFEVIENEIDVVCPHCGYHGTLPEEYAGKWMKCPSCGEVFKMEENT